MRAAALLSELRRRDIEVHAIGSELRCSAPAGTLTAELRDELRRHKDDLLRLLSSAQAAAAQARAIVPLRAGNRTPVFAVPGHNGDVFCYRALAQSLNDDRALYGLQPPGLQDDDETLVRVEDLAAYFASQIRAFRPQGRLIIAGYCAGGSVAFELAQQMRRDGADVALVALFGSPYPSYFRWPTQLWLRVSHEAGRAVKHSRALLTQPWGRYFADKRRERDARRAAQKLGAPDAMHDRRDQVGEATLSAVRRYSPKPYPGIVHLFIPCRDWVSSGSGALRWRALAARGEDYFGPEGCRRPDMLREANAPVFAEFFRRSCEKDG